MWSAVGHRAECCGSSTFLRYTEAVKHQCENRTNVVAGWPSDTSAAVVRGRWGLHDKMWHSCQPCKLTRTELNGNRPHYLPRCIDMVPRSWCTTAARIEAIYDFHIDLVAGGNRALFTKVRTQRQPRWICQGPASYHPTTGALEGKLYVLSISQAC